MVDLYIPFDAKPALKSRRTEFSAWMFAVFLLVAVVVTVRNGVVLGLWFYVGVVFVSLAAMIISLNNWIERNTLLRIDRSGLAYRSPLRSLSMAWQQVQRVQIVEGALNKKIYVFGENSFFSFHTLAEASRGGRVRARMGFAQGERILQIILERAKLPLMKHQGGSVYYARE